MDAFEVGTLAGRQGTAEVAYTESIEHGSLSVGLYTVPAGHEDPQEPHTEDEVYHVVEGRATLRVGDEERVVRPGSVVYVPRGTEHRFLDVEETLRTVVFFAPAEGTLG